MNTRSGPGVPATELDVRGEQPSVRAEYRQGAI
jgi:hypothetical protein